MCKRKANKMYKKKVSLYGLVGQLVTTLNNIKKKKKKNGRS